MGQYFPIAIDQIKSKTYFIFFSINAVSLIVSIFIKSSPNSPALLGHVASVLRFGQVLTIYFPETKGKTLEDMDDLFGELLADPERDHEIATD